MNGLLALSVPDQASLWGLNVVIHATFLTAVSLLIALLFRKAAAMRYWVLCFGLMLVLASPLISAVIQTTGAGWLTIAAAPTAAAASAANVMRAEPSEVSKNTDRTIEHDQLPSAVSLESQPDPSQEVASDIRQPADANVATTVASAPVAAISPVESVQPNWWQAPLRFAATPLMFVWGIGSLFLLLRMSISWYRMSRILRDAQPVLNERLRAAFDRACRTTGCNSKRWPELVVSSAVSGPIAAGVLRGKIVLPQNLLERVEAGAMADVLVHEVAHVIRRDQIIVLLQNLVSAIYWPHPLIWRLNRELAKAREEVCDNFVLAATDAPIYSRTLLSLAQFVQQPESMPGSVGFFTSRWKLEQRIAGLLDADRDRTTFLSKRGWLFVTATTLILAALMCVGTITLATAENEQAGSIAEEEASDSQRVIRGTVRGPDGQPVSAARVIALRNFRANLTGNTSHEVFAETTTDSAGTYSIVVPAELAKFADRRYFEQKWTSVLAAKPGFGPDEIAIQVNATNADLTLASASISIRGRILDLEGRPVRGARVRLEQIDKPAQTKGVADAVAVWLENARGNPAVFTEETMPDLFEAHPTVAYYPTYKTLEVVSVLGMETTTDEGGTFEISDIGDDRLATFRIDAPTISSTLLPVVARRMEPVNTPRLDSRYRIGKTFGNEFVFAGEPSQLIRGEVRDKQTGKPIAGAEVDLTQYPDDVLPLHGFVKTTTGADGRYVLTGVPKRPESSERAIRLSIQPARDQPYFRSEHDVPAGTGLDPIDFDIELTPAIWAQGRVTDANSGEAVHSLVAYHPYLDNPNASGHESFRAGMASLGYDEMFETGSDGNFRVPALRGRGVLRVVAANDYQYELMPIPGTNMEADGRVRRLEKERVYHVIMPGNAIVELDVADDAPQIEVAPSLKRLPTLAIRALTPEGKQASGFFIAGRFINNRITATGRQISYWQSEPSDGSTIELILGNQDERRRPIMLFDSENKLGAVVWLDELASEDKPVDIRLQPCAKVVGRLVDGDGKPMTQGYVVAGVGGITQINAISSTKGGGRVVVSNRIKYPVMHIAMLDDQGRFEYIVPPGDGYSMILSNAAAQPTLLEDVKLAPGETLDLGTIDAFTGSSSDGVSLNSELHSPSSPIEIAGNIINSDGSAAVGAMVAVIAGRRDTRSSTVPLAEGRSGQGGEFRLRMSSVSEDDYYRPTLIARTNESGLSFKTLHLNQSASELTLILQPAEPIRVRLVDLEGQSASDLSVRWYSIVPRATELMATDGVTLTNLERRPQAAPPLLSTDAEGWLEVTSVPAGHGVYLEVEGDANFAPQILALNTGRPEQRAERDATYRSLVKNMKPRETATIPLAPSQIFSGTVLLGDTDKPAANTRITIWSSQQDAGGSMITKEGKTDGFGHFRLNPYPGLRFEIQVYPAEGSPYQAKRIPDLRWDSSEDVSAMIIRLPVGAIARGRVVDAVSEQPVEGVYVAYHVDGSNLNQSDHFISGWQAMKRTDAEGNFALPALPGRGTLVAHAGKNKPYVMKSIGSRELELGKPGGQHRYAHAFEPIELSEISDLQHQNGDQPVTIRIQPSSSVLVSLRDVDGMPVENAIYTSTLAGSPYWLSYRASPSDIPGDTIRIHGIPAGGKYPIYFWHSERKIGAAAVLSEKNDQLIVTMMPCGSARARLIDLAKQPVSDYSAGLQQVITPGPPADRDFAINFDRKNSMGIAKSDANGEIVFEALIPGAIYQLDYRSGGKIKTLGFIPKSGELHELGEVLVDREELD